MLNPGCSISQYGLGHEQKDSAIFILGATLSLGFVYLVASFFMRFMAFIVLPSMDFFFFFSFFCKRDPLQVCGHK